MIHHNPPPAPAKRPGFALVFTLVAIVLISALITATMFRVTETTYLAKLSTLHLHATAEAERQLWLTMSSPTTLALTTAPIGSVSTTAATTPTTTSTITITKMDSATLWLTATTTVQRNHLHATRHVALSAHISPPGQPLRPILGPAWVDLY
jgi:hypothetical protein